MNKRYKEDIESFLNYVEGKETNPTPHALSVYRKYEKKLDDVDIWPDIFGDLYDALYICNMGSGYYTIDGIHDCFPKTHYKSIKELYQSRLEKTLPLTLRNVYEGFYHNYYDEFLEEDEFLENRENLGTAEKDKIVSDFYNVAFHGGNPNNICDEAWALYREYSGKNLYDPELWPEIFNKILGERFIDEDSDGYFVSNQLGWWDKKDFKSYEEIYRDLVGWESDILDFRTVWSKFYKYYMDMDEALIKYGRDDDDY